MAKLKNGVTFCFRKEWSQPSSIEVFGVETIPKLGQHSDYPDSSHLGVGVGIAIGVESPAGRLDPKDSGPAHHFFDTDSDSDADPDSKSSSPAQIWKLPSGQPLANPLIFI